MTSEEITKLRNRIKDVETNFCTDQTLTRYIKARNHDLAAAEKMLRETLKWRKENKPEEIKGDDDACKKSKKLKQLYHIGTSKTGEPIFYVKPAVNPYPPDIRIKYLLFVLETVSNRMNCESGKMIWVMDLSDFGKDTFNDSYGLEVAKTTLSILQNHYPERLLKFLVLDSPWYFNLFWHAVKIFIDPKTKEKIIFMGKDKDTIIKTIIDENMLSSDYGGKLVITEEMKIDWDLVTKEILEKQIKK